MLIKITFFFVAIRTKYERCEPKYEVIDGPFVTVEKANAARDANPMEFEPWENKSLVVLEGDTAPFDVGEAR